VLGLSSDEGGISMSRCEPRCRWLTPAAPAWPCYLASLFAEVLNERALESLDCCLGHAAWNLPRTCYYLPRCALYSKQLAAGCRSSRVSVIFSLYPSNLFPHWIATIAMAVKISSLCCGEAHARAR
jgi:hypothetical protein